MARLDDSPRKLLGQIFHFSSATLTASFITLLQGILVLKLVEPTVYGIWMSLALILDYGIYFHLGLVNGLERSIPFFKGMNRDDKAQSAAETCKFTLLLLILTGVALLLGITTLLGRHWRTEVRIGVISVAISAFLYLGTQYYTALLKVNQRFKEVGYLQLIIAIGMLICLLLIWRYGFYGFCMRAIFTTCLGLAYTAWRARDKSRVRFDGAMALYLVKIGLPLMTIGAIALILFSFDRLLILTFLGSTLMGYYGISIALLRMLNLFPTVVGQVFAPVMANVYGATLSPRSLLKYAARASLTAFCITISAVVVLYFLIPPVIIHFLPKYTYGITAARISLLTSLLLALSVGPGFFLQTIMRQFEYFIVILLSAIVILSSVLMLFARGYDLSGVAWGMVIGYAVNTAGVWIYTFVFCHREKKTGRESAPQSS